MITIKVESIKNFLHLNKYSSTKTHKNYTNYLFAYNLLFQWIYLEKKDKDDEEQKGNGLKLNFNKITETNHKQDSDGSSSPFNK